MIKMYFKDADKEFVMQGDLFQDFPYILWTELVNGEPESLEIDISYFVILTQACDLEQDFCGRNISKDENGIMSHNAFLPSILICPAHLAERFREGEHLQNFKIKTQRQNSDKWPVIMKNDDKRYHYLDGDKAMEIPDLVVDFKHYFTIPTDKLQSVLKKHYTGSLRELYRENLSHRFAFYLSRIGLPDMMKLKKP